MSRFHLIGICVFVLFATSASATPIITVGSHDLLPDKANQPVDINVTGGDLVPGLNLYLQVNDGTSGPTIQSIDVLSGTIFDGNNTGESSGALGGNASLPYWNGYATTTTSNGTVSADGLLATVMIDTTGLTAGMWSLDVDFDYGTSRYTSDFTSFVPATLVNGSINIVPEPGSLLLLLSAAIGLTGWQLCRRRRG